MQDTANDRLTQLVDAARRLCEECVHVLLVKPHLKEPLPGPNGSWQHTDDTDKAESLIRETWGTEGDLNLGAVVGGERGSSVVVVDVDGPQAWGKLRALGCNSAAPCWVSHTPSGGVHVYYHVPDVPLKRVVRAGGLPVDFLVNGYVLVPPSRTDKGDYRWAPGHSPRDISLVELADPPNALLEWWVALSAPHIPSLRDGGQERDRAWRLLAEPIPQGTRNGTLTRIGGWLRLYHPRPIVEALLLAINDGRCNPPLDPKEVAGIAASVCKYLQLGANGHPKSVVPYFYRGEAPHE